MKNLIPYACSTGTVITMWLVGNKDHRAWISGLISQCIWLAFIISFGAWGLLPLTIVLTFMYARNLKLWKNETPTMTVERYNQVMADLDTVEGNNAPT